MKAYLYILDGELYATIDNSSNAARQAIQDEYGVDVSAAVRVEVSAKTPKHIEVVKLMNVSKAKNETQSSDTIEQAAEIETAE